MSKDRILDASLTNEDMDSELTLRPKTLDEYVGQTALNALSATSADALFKAIQSNNTSYLKKLPGIGPKAAAQIILDLKGHLAEDGGKADPKQYDEVRAALKSLGFRVKEIDDALSSISDPTLDSQGLLKAALKKLRKNK